MSASLRVRALPALAAELTAFFRLNWADAGAMAETHRRIAISLITDVFIYLNVINKLTLLILRAENTILLLWQN